MRPGFRIHRLLAASLALAVASLVACDEGSSGVCDPMADPATDPMDPAGVPGGPDDDRPAALLGHAGCELGEPLYEVEVRDAIDYGDQHERQHLTAYLPVGLDDAPAMVFVHGGGWWYGSRNDFADRAMHFAERGIATFTVDYRLADDETPSFPGNVQDVVCATRWIKTNADELGIDADALAAYGASAGGHLAAMLGVLEGNEAILEDACGDPSVSPKVRLVMNYFGYVDMEVTAAIDPEDTRVTRMLGASWDDDPQRWRSASPASYVGPGDAVFLIGQGARDEVVPPEVTESFHRRLQRVGIPSVTVLVDEGLHGFYGHPELDAKVRCSFEPLAALMLR